MPTETLMMKDSKIDWLGYIPQEWNVKKIKYCAYLKTGTTPDGNDGIVDENSDYNWYTPGDFVDNYILQLSERNILENAVKKYHIKLYSPDSVLMVCIGATVGKIGYIDKYAYSNQQITALMPKKDIIGKFLLYLLSAMTKYMNENAQYTTLPIINNTYLSSINIVLPNRMQEQQSIADFLDEKCEKIDKVTSEIEGQIQVLEDYKKSLITETVTKGLDKNVLMKDSGIDWIGQIPGNWQIKKIKYLFKVINGSTPDSDYLDYWDGDITWITPADMPDFGYISKGERSITLKGYKSCGTTLVPSNSIVVSSRAPIGKINITENTLCTNQGCKCLVSNNLCNKYYYYFLYSQKEQLIDAGRGTTFIELSTYALSNFYALLPPIKIQEQIADYLDKECEKIDKTINDKKEQLETIKEYKKALIYEYVTGKKRVAC